MDKDLNLIKEQDKVFPQSDKVSHSKAISRNRYGTTLVTDIYKPKHAGGKLPAIAISGPLGVVKEQSSGLYAQELAGRGFLTIVLDPSYTGGSGREPCYVAFPDINTEDFCAAVDFFSTCDDVDAKHIDILDICGWGGIVLNTAAIDTRIKATVTFTTYDMSRMNTNGHFDATDADAHYELCEQLNEQHTADTENGSYTPAGGLPDTLPDDAPQSLRDYYAYYKTKRDYRKHSFNLNGGWSKTSASSFTNVPILPYSDEICSAILITHGEKAHSRYFSEDALRKLKGDGRELLTMPRMDHVDLCDQMNVIPFDKTGRFLVENLKQDSLYNR